MLLGVVAVVAGCGGSSSHARSAAEVEGALRAVGLHPQRTRIVLTVEAGTGTSRRPPPLQYAISTPTYDELRPVATYEVDHRRAVVYVYATADAAAPYDLAPRDHVLRARNVLAVTVHGTLSRRLRSALRQLR